MEAQWNSPGVCLVAAHTAWGQFAVEDVYVGIQAAITAMNSARATVMQAEQIANEVLMIKHQLEQLAYDAANLTKSPLQSSRACWGSWER